MGSSNQSYIFEIILGFKWLQRVCKLTPRKGEEPNYDHILPLVEKGYYHFGLTRFKIL